MTGTQTADTDFAELHDELRAVARDLLGKHDPERALPAGIVASAGWFGLEVPEEFDGAGATFAETAVVLAELGRAAVESPSLGAVLAVGGLALVEPGPTRDRLQTALATGKAIATLVVPGTEPTATVPFRLQRADGGYLISGRAEFVADAGTADRLLLPAADVDGTPVLIELGGETAGLVRTPQPVVDATRKLAIVDANSVPVQEDSILRFVGDADAAVRGLRERAVVAVACDGLGIAEAMLAATVSYAGTREQFGRPIGSFQAVKHACADMLVHTTVGRHLVDAAVTAVATGADDASVAAARAASYIGDAAVEVAGKAMQLHGGIGYTWESGVHRYLKRATLNRVLYGSPVTHRRVLAAGYR